MSFKNTGGYSGINCFEGIAHSRNQKCGSLKFSSFIFTDSNEKHRFITSDSNRETQKRQKGAASRKGNP